MPDETVIDGEVIALDDNGWPSFNILQNFGSSKAPLQYFVFDVMILAGRDVMPEPLEVRRALLENKILPKLSEPFISLRDDKPARSVRPGVVDQKSLTRPSLPSSPESRFGVLPLRSFTSATL